MVIHLTKITTECDRPFIHIPDVRFQLTPLTLAISLDFNRMEENGETFNFSVHHPVDRNHTDFNRSLDGVRFRLPERV